MNRCLVCEEIIEEGFNSLFCDVDKFCNGCLNKFKERNEKFFIEGVEVEILYFYDDYFRDILYRYKGCYDYVLKDIFLKYKLNSLKRKYKRYSIVLAPSNKCDEIKRGFNHLEEVFSCLKLPIIKCFRKTKKWKQSDKNIIERKDIQKVIKIDKTCLKGVKRVLIVDDVLTSGSTIKTLISQLPSSIDKKVLILSSNCQIQSNEIV